LDLAVVTDHRATQAAASARLRQSATNLGVSMSVRRRVIVAWVVALITTSTAVGAQSSVTGATPAAIQPTVDAAKVALGPLNPSVGGSFASGRREINFDGVPDSFAAPASLPGTFFKVNSPRGIVLPDGGQVSADALNLTSTPLRFGNIFSDFITQFQTFSAERLFAVPASTTLDIAFFVPGASTPAAVTGFGAVFTDVDAPGVTKIEACNAAGAIVETVTIPATNGGLSFGEVHFASAQIARVKIHAGTVPLNAVTVSDTPVTDAVAMDDLIYGEPQALSTVPVACGVSDLVVTSSAAPSPIALGATTTITTTVTNAGGVEAVGVQVAVAAPGATIVSSSVDVGTCSGASCAIGTLAPGQVVSARTVVRPLSIGALTVTSTATTTTPQATVSNDSGQVIVDVTPPPAAQSVVVVRKLLTLRRNRVALVLSCPTGPAPRCTGVITFRAGSKRLARRAYSLAGGRKATFTVVLNAAGRRHFGTRKRARVTVSATNVSPPLVNSRTSVPVVIRR
jgi:Domain of unknown function DUF11